MPYLLDTHTLLWWLDDPDNISMKAREIIANSENVIYISSITTWEIVIKKALKKLKVPDSIFDLIIGGGFVELPISISHTKMLSTLPKIHDDPFDRMLVAQAMVEKCSILTRDKIIPKYGVKVVRA